MAISLLKKYNNFVLKMWEEKVRLVKGQIGRHGS